MMKANNIQIYILLILFVGFGFSSVESLSIEKVTKHTTQVVDVNSKIIENLLGVIGAQQTTLATLSDNIIADVTTLIHEGKYEQANDLLLKLEPIYRSFEAIGQKLGQIPELYQSNLAQENIDDLYGLLSVVKHYLSTLRVQAQSLRDNLPTSDLGTPYSGLQETLDTLVSYIQDVMDVIE